MKPRGSGNGDEPLRRGLTVPWRSLGLVAGMAMLWFVPDVAQIVTNGLALLAPTAIVAGVVTVLAYRSGGRRRTIIAAAIVIIAATAAGRVWNRQQVSVFDDSWLPSWLASAVQVVVLDLVFLFAAYATTVELERLRWPLAAELIGAVLAAFVVAPLALFVAAFMQIVLGGSWI